MTNIYNKKTFIVSGAPPLFTSVTVFDFASAGLGASNVSNGFVYLSSTIIFSDSANQVGTRTLEQGFRRTSGGSATTVGSQFGIIPKVGDAHMASTNYGYDFNTATVIITCDYFDSVPSLVTHEIIVESYLFI